MSFQKVSVHSKSATEMINITSLVQSHISHCSVQDGICLVYCPHTTSGLTINENADPDVKTDMIKEINKIVPFEDQYKHYEGNSAAHIKATFTGMQVMIPIHEGRLTLGTWQGIYFCEYDGPRNRTVQIQIIKEQN